MTAAASVQVTNVHLRWTQGSHVGDVLVLSGDGVHGALVSLLVWCRVVLQRVENL